MDDSKKEATDNPRQGFGQDSKQLTYLTLLNTALQLVSQVGIKFVSFFINMVIMRRVDMPSLAIANVRLSLLRTTIVALGRDAFRQTVPLNDPGDSQEKQEASSYNEFLQLCYPVALGVTFLFCVLWLITPVHMDKTNHVTPATILYASSALIELLSEPGNLLLRAQLRFRERIAIETFASLAQSVAQLAMVVLQTPSPLLMFASSQLLYSLLVLSGTSYYQCAPWPSTLLTLTDNRYVHRWLSFYKHVAVKQVLSQFEGYAMTFLNVCPSLEHQAMFDTINRLASSVARILFAPIEQNAYTLYARLNRCQHDLEQANGHLSTLLRLTATLTLVGLSVVLPFGHELIALYGIRHNTRLASRILSLFGLYIPLLAWNGLTECLLQATANESELRNHRNFLLSSCLASNLLLLLFNYTTLGGIGPLGLTLFICLNMLVRCVYNHFYCAQWLEVSPGRLLANMCPDRRITAIAFPIMLSINYNGRNIGILQWLGINALLWPVAVCICEHSLIMVLLSRLTQITRDGMTTRAWITTN